VNLLTGEEKSAVMSLKERFREYEKQKPYRALKAVIDKTPSKKWVIFYEFLSTFIAGYQGELFIRTKHQAKYYHTVEKDVRYRSFDPKLFDAVIQKSGGLEAQLSLTSQPVRSGCYDASYLRLTITTPKVSRILYYYCNEPPVVLNLADLVLGHSEQ
jgi:hypothetical protein